MKKIISIIIMTTLIMSLSACNPNTTITEQEYNNVVSERDSLLLEIEELKKDVANVTTVNTENEIDTTIKEQDLNEITQTEHEVAAGKVETERKFVIDVKNLPAEFFETDEVYDITQTYISYSPEMRVRSIIGKTQFYTMTMKIPLDNKGLSRQEIDFTITAEEYDELVKKQVGNTILKTRYQFWIDERHVCVDVYAGELDGLAVAEVEFKSVEEADNYVPLDWFGEEVTSDSRYKNANLSKNGMPE